MAQLDRFMFLIELDYPSEAEDVQIARTTTGEDLPALDELEPVLAEGGAMARRPLGIDADTARALVAELM